MHRGQNFCRTSLRVIAAALAITCGATNGVLAAYRSPQEISRKTRDILFVGTIQPSISVSAETKELATLNDSYPSSEPAIGNASWYDPPDRQTASGELYDSNSWTGAIQFELRTRFLQGGIAQQYRYAYALVEHGNKQVILRINDVGPLKPGRIIDLNKRAMQYFDQSLELGLLGNVKVTPLPGQNWALGPVETIKGWCGP